MTAKKIQLVICQPIQDHFTILDIVRKSPPLSWKSVFDQAHAELADISEILLEREKEFGRFYPRRQNVFRAFELTPLQKVRVVIFGQDPYHSSSKLLNGEPTAQGLSFAVHRRDKIPPSLKTIYTELVNSVKDFKTPLHGDLTAWAKQGILLCNTCLTVDPGQAGSHGEIWLGFIRHVIDAILEKNKNTIFVLWGRKAQKLTRLIGNRGKILEAAHPSPFAAKHFLGCNHFNLINEHLKQLGQETIEWNLQE